MSWERHIVVGAANRLETLLPVMQEFVRIMRSGEVDDTAYAMAYWLRREIGYVTRDLGVGVPVNCHLRTVEKWAREQL